MKTQTSILMALCLIFGYSFSQTKQVPFEEIKKIADRNAEALWGNVSPGEPIPYYSPDDEIIAYRFNYAINQEFPDEDELIQDCGEGLKAGDRKAQHGSEDFGKILVSARTDLPVILSYGTGLSPKYTYGAFLTECAETHIGDHLHLQRVYFINPANIWYNYTNGSEEIYIKPHPPVKSVDRELFDSINDANPILCQTGDYNNQWQKYLYENKTLSKSEVYLPYYNECCPFYSWSYGCAPTAAAMLLAYWDNRSLYYENNFSKFVDYHFERFDPMSSTCNPDVHVPNVQEELALAMNTTPTGGTFRADIPPGYEHVANVINEYSFSAYYHGGLNAGEIFNETVDEIDGGRPIHLHIPPSPPDDGHSVCGVGYNDVDVQIAIHDPNEPNVQWHTPAFFDALTNVYPGGFYGLGIEIEKPEGDHLYCGGGWGEDLHAGDFYEITWDYDEDPGSYVRLQYNTSSGNGSWTNIISNTPNDGIFDWDVPSGIASDNCRLKVIVHSSSGEYWGADGSFGDFQINPGGSLAILGDDNKVNTTTDPDYYQFIDNTSNWCAVAVRNNTAGEYWGIRMYTDNTFTIEQEFDNTQYPVNFIVMDGNHSPSKYRGIKVKSYFLGATHNASVEYEGGEETLSPGSSSYTWPAGDVVEMFDVYLTPGDYSFDLDITSGSADLDIALFGSSGTAYYDIGSHHIASSENSGSGVDEKFNYSITTADFYGFCVWAKDANSASYDIKIYPHGTWLGLVSTDWNDPANWSGNILPDYNTNVTIPDDLDVPHSPVIEDCEAYCLNLFLEPGAIFTMNDYGHLHCSGNFNTSNGQFTMNGQSYLHFKGFGDTYWRDNNEDDTYHTVIVNKNTAGVSLNLRKNATVLGGFSIVQGVFEIENHQTLTVYDNDEIAFEVYDGGELLMDESNECIEVAGDFHFYPGSQINITDGVIKCGGDFVVDENLSYDISLSGGRLTMNGSSDQFINYLDGNPFHINDLAINKESGVCYLQSSNLDIAGSLWIANGTLSCEDGSASKQTHLIKIGGNWINDVGDIGFDESSGHVVFNGGDYAQDISDESFNILEVNKTSGGAIRMDGTHVSCSNYDWTAGSVRVLNGGSFTGNDLIDNGIYGNYFLQGEASIINLTNEEGAGNLGGSINIINGTMNVFGGGDSFWPWPNDASIVMSGGVLDFHDASIFIIDYFNLTEDITGGEIRTSQKFDCNREDFTPEGGTFVFYGNSDATINQVQGTLYDVDISKTDTESNAVTLVTNLTVTNDLNLETGELLLNGHTLKVGHNMDVHGILTMDNPSDVLNVGTNASDKFTIHGDGTANFNEGTSNIYGIIETKSGCSFLCSLNHSTVFKGTEQGSIYNYEPLAIYGNIKLAKSSSATNVATRIYGPEIMEIYGDLIIHPYDEFVIIGETAVVNGLVIDYPTSVINAWNIEGYLQVNNDFTLNGMLDINSGTVCITGIFTNNGSLDIHNGGQFNPDDCLFDLSTKTMNLKNSKGLCGMYGSFNMSDGLFRIAYDDILFSSNSINNISGGIIECGGSFEVEGQGVFQPTDGTLEFGGGDVGPAWLICDRSYDNYFHNLVIDRDTACELNTNIEVKNDFTIENGIVTSPDTLWIGGSYTNNAGDLAFDEGTGTIIFNGSNDASILTDEQFYNLTIEKSQGGNLTWDWSAIVGNELNINSGSLIGNSDAVLKVVGNVNINQGGILELTPGCELQVDDGSNISVAENAKIKILGEEANGILVTNITTGTYSFDVSGIIEASYTIFENMDQDGINVGPLGQVSPGNPDYRFNHCTYRKGAPAPSTLLTLHNDQIFIVWDPYFENTYGNTGCNIRKVNAAGEVTIKSPLGDFAGPEYEEELADAKANRIIWEEMDVELDLKVMLEGPFNGTGMNTGINGILPLDQPFNSNPSADWYYTGTEILDTMPANTTEWILVELRDATNPTAALPGTMVAKQAALLLNDGTIVDLDGASKLQFNISYDHKLFTVLRTKNHLGIIGANRLMKNQGKYVYDFTTGPGKVLGGPDGHKMLDTGVWGMMSGDGDGNGQIQFPDKVVWNEQAGKTGYLEGDFNLNGQVNNPDKNNIWVPNIGKSSQIPE